MKRIFLSVILIVVLIVPITLYAKDDYELVEWSSPVPYLSDYDIDPNELVDLLKDRIFVIYHDPVSIKLWTKKTGKEEVYPKARFAMGLALLNASKKDILNILTNFKEIKTFMPQFEIFEAVAEFKKADKSQFMVKSSQVYKSIILNYKTDFLFQYDVYPDSSISKLMHQGDVGASVMRYELLPVGQDQTILVYTLWMDLDTAKSTFGMLIRRVPGFGVVTPVGNAIIELTQIKEKINGAVKKPAVLPAKPEIPVFSKGAVSRSTLQKLTDLGSVVFAEDRQWIKIGKDTEKMGFLSSMVHLNGKIDTIKPFSSDFPRYPEYLDFFEKVIVNKDRSVDWYMKIKLIGSLGLSLFWRITPEWTDENTIKFRSTRDGNIFPMWGFWEWIPIENDNTILVFSTAQKVNENAPLLVRFAQKYVPNFDLTSSLFVGMQIVEKQCSWIDQQLEKK